MFLYLYSSSDVVSGFKYRDSVREIFKLDSSKEENEKLFPMLMHGCAATDHTSPEKNSQSSGRASFISVNRLQIHIYDVEGEEGIWCLYFVFVDCHLDLLTIKICK